MRIPFIVQLAFGQLLGCLTLASGQSHYSELSLCPRPCLDLKQQDWTTYHDTVFLEVCDQPMLVTFNIYTSLDKDAADQTFRACTAGDDTSASNLLLTDTTDNSTIDGSSPSQVLTKRQSGSCGATASSAAVATVLELATAGPSNDRSMTALRTLQNHLMSSADCDETIMLSAFKGAIVGSFSGATVDNAKMAETLLSSFNQRLDASADNRHRILQVCGNGRISNNAYGVITGNVATLEQVRLALKTWNDAGCIEQSAGRAEQVDISVYTTTAAGSFAALRHARSLSARADCRTIRVVSGDSCASLAQRCGVSGPVFESFNTKANLCSTLAVGQAVCCSSGTLPNIRPPQNPDGSCAAYTVNSGEYCQLIASSNGLTLAELDTFNKQTWGWTGCDNLQLGIRICLSAGRPPMPAPVSNAVCGPTVPGTLPSSTTALANLNPCPLKACCNVWGQCGLTEDFCIVSQSSTGNPGTSQPGKNGCISNCGLQLKTDSVAPAQFKKVAYFEAWNLDRPCLKMHVERIDPSYTHVHFSFGTISRDFQVVIADNLKGQWDAFRSWKTNAKKILAFGGWSFSTEYDTFPIFAQSVSAQNRNLFADRVVQFAIANNLDGLDFDWEYPGAPDIPGIPPGHPDDGKNYLEFLKLVRQKLPREKSLSIAAPASYWYLKGFPIAEMAPYLDYIIYMTYDFHGQWDAGNKWANPGCPAGNCLRSHVNSTETMNALVMITKAGVPSGKVVVGVSSYGRSFKMADPKCFGGQCAFLGSATQSPAKPGRCTLTGGYISNAEIDEIIRTDKNILKWYDGNSGSDYLVYGGTEWVGYMSESTKQVRTSFYKAWNFGGTSDWAVDLQTFINDGQTPPNSPPSNPQPPVNTCNTDDNSWSRDLSIPQGYLPVGDDGGDTCRVLITIVNLTPHTLIYDRAASNTYQMSEWDFGDIKPGNSRPNAIQYNCGKNDKNKVDDAGEAYYQVQGTNRRFTVKARHKYPNGLPPVDYVPWRIILDMGGFGIPPREYVVKGFERSINLVITGSESYGKFYTSVDGAPVRWMSAIKDVIKDRPLRAVIMPGTHDAGMSKIGQYGFAGSEADTRNQGFNIYDQLRVGSRHIDFRVGYIEPDQTMVLAHTNFPVTTAMGGKSGERLSEAIDGINRFTRENPGEVVILSVRYLWTSQDLTFTRWRKMNDGELRRLFDEFQAINNLCRGITEGIENMAMKDLMDFTKDGSKPVQGCVIISLDENSKGFAPSGADFKRGIYCGRSCRANANEGSFNNNNYWAESDVVEGVAVKQKNVWNSRDKNQFHISEWVITPGGDKLKWETLQTAATMGLYDPLFHFGVNNMSPQNFPNAISMDYIGQDDPYTLASFENANNDIRALALGLNLYMISENCELSKSKHPLPKLRN